MPVLHTRRRGKKYTGNIPVGQTSFHTLLMLSTIISSAVKGIVKGFLRNIGVKIPSARAEYSRNNAYPGGVDNLTGGSGVVLVRYTVISADIVNGGVFRHTSSNDGTISDAEGRRAPYFYLQ